MAASCPRRPGKTSKQQQARAATAAEPRDEAELLEGTAAARLFLVTARRSGIWQPPPHFMPGATAPSAPGTLCLYCSLFVSNSEDMQAAININQPSWDTEPVVEHLSVVFVLSLLSSLTVTQRVSKKVCGS